MTYAPFYISSLKCLLKCCYQVDRKIFTPTDWYWCIYHKKVPKETHSPRFIASLKRSQTLIASPAAPGEDLPHLSWKKNSSIWMDPSRRL